MRTLHNKVLASDNQTLKVGTNDGYSDENYGFSLTISGHPKVFKKLHIVPGGSRIQRVPSIHSRLPQQQKGRRHRKRTLFRRFSSRKSGTAPLLLLAGPKWAIRYEQPFAKSIILCPNSYGGCWGIQPLNLFHPPPICIRPCILSIHTGKPQKNLFFLSRPLREGGGVLIKNNLF